MSELKDLHIVIAEDDLDDGEFVIQSFSKHPAFTKIEWVKNGKELLNLLKTSPGAPDVILTDINMPIVDGIEALEQIFKDPHLSSISTFVYSSTVNPAYQVKCKELGVKSFLIKPFSLNDYDKIPEQILQMIGK